MTQQTNNTPTPDELSLINKYARNPLNADEVYCFNMTLCDNEIDRDFERFSVEALKQLSELFVGRTGISDHDMSSKNQTARIFKAWLEEDKSKKTSLGEAYVALKAKAYMLKSESNSDLISQIEAGIKKEVSVGCSMKSMTCSVCGKDMKKHECNHIKGRYYAKKLCHGILDDASDAYEWSFVAVPAQKNAGVTKSFSSQLKKETVPQLQPDSEQAVYSKSYVQTLEAQANEVRLFKNHLLGEIRKFALIAMPRVNIDTFTATCAEMNFSELKNLMEGLKAQASEVIPVSLQLKAVSERKTNTNNNAFKI